MSTVINCAIAYSDALSGTWPTGTASPPAQIFQFMDEDFIEADEELASAKDDLDRMSRNIPFLRKVTAVVEEIESIQDQMSEEARLFFGWRPYSGKWAFPNPVWTELRQAFQEGSDGVQVGHRGHQCPLFTTHAAISPGRWRSSSKRLSRGGAAGNLRGSRLRDRTGEFLRAKIIVQLKKPTTTVRPFAVRAERVKPLAQLAGFWSQSGAFLRVGLRPHSIECLVALSFCVRTTSFLARKYDVP